MSFTDRSSVITSSFSETTRSGVIFLAKVVIISSLLAEFSAASSISTSAGVIGGGGGNSVGLESIIGGGAGTTGSSGGGGGSSGGGAGNYYSGTEVWFRNLDTQLLRLGSRLDQLMIRMDHLDSRVGRVQSQGHLRFDSIETSMQTTRQRLDLWSNQLNLLEEQLTRKWKNMESSIDSKLDSKFNLIQRDNRRHNEFISSSFNSVTISQEKLAEKVVNSLSEMNSTVRTTKNMISNSTSSLLAQVSRECSSQSSVENNTLTDVLNTFLTNLTLKSCPQNSVQHQQQNNNHHRSHHYPHHSGSRHNNNLVGYEQPLPPSHSPNYFHPSSSSNSNQQPNSTTQVQLITSKVTNMFDELVKRSQNLEAIVKDTYTMSNWTRREVQEGFRNLLPIVNQISNGGNNGGAGSMSSNREASSTEVMSVGLVFEAVANVESISRNLVTKMGALNRSMEERLGEVSMLLNGLLESCSRIQYKEALIEEGIAETLDKLLDVVDNSTRNATETWHETQRILLKEQQQLHHHYQRHHHHQQQQQSKRNTSSCSDNLIMASLQRSSVNQQHQQRYAASQGHNVNQASTPGTGGSVGEYQQNTRNRSFGGGGGSHPVSSSSWGLSLHRGGEEDETGFEIGGTDHENIVGTGLLGGGMDENEEHNNGDNDDHVDGDDDRHHDSGGEDESEEPLKISQSKLLFNRERLPYSNSHQYPHQHHHHARHHHQYASQSRAGGGGGGNLNRNGNPSTNLPDLYPIPYPSTTNSEGGIGSISGTNIRSPPQSSMTFSSHHNGNDNVNLAQQGLSPSSPPLLGVRRTTTTSDNNNGMGVVSSNSAHVSGNSNNHNHNGGDLHGGGGGLDVDDLSEEDKKRFWETWLSPHTPRRGSVPE